MADRDDKKPPEEAPEKKPVAGEEPATPELTPEEEAAAKAKAEAEAKAKKEAAAAAKAAAEAAKPPWLRDPATPEWAEADEDPLVQALRGTHGDALVSARTFSEDLIIEATREGIVDLCRALRDDHGYELFIDACGVHFPKREEAPFEVVYILYNLSNERRVRVKVLTDEGTDVPSLCSIWPGVNWCEREVYDMYGIRFADHPDMTRILLWEGFNGYPLRKDFPIEGIDTGAAIYPEYYEASAGPVAGTGTGWKPTPPPEPVAEEPAEGESEAEENASS